MKLKPWREIAVPHEDVLKGTFHQAEFAADLSLVHDGAATPEYQNAELFYERTFITQGMRLLLDSVIKRLNSKGGDPVIQLQTAFGGGKTHTMLAVYHLAKGESDLNKLQGISELLKTADVVKLPKANIAVLDGIKLSPNQPKKRGGIIVNTMWGELAWQLGKEKGYGFVKDADTSGTSPGKEVITQLLKEYAPCVILIDELVAYIRQFEDGKKFTGGTYDSNLSFIQALTESLKAVPNAILLASLPESDKEAGSQRGANALRALEHYFGRIQAIWKPVATEEAFEIVRRRLFTKIVDKTAAETICRAFADFYTSTKDDFPNDTQESRYFDRLIQAYPIHPEIFDRLYEDWSSLENFQRTRGVLKLMAKVIHRLWKDGNNDLLIMPGNLPLYDAETRNEVLYYLPQGWDPVLEGDIDGERAETTEIEDRDTRFGSMQACKRVARTIFLASAPTTNNQIVRGREIERIVLGCAQPGQQVSIFQDALRRLSDRLHYLNSANNRYWFDTRPNLRREMEERKRRFQEKEDIYPAIKERLQKLITPGVFGGVHVFTGSADIPDDFSLRLVVLSTETPFSKIGDNALKCATEILKTRGNQPRQKQNRLIFLVADQDTVSRLNDQVRSTLAWATIVDDIKDAKLNLDQFQARQANQSLEDANDSLKRMIREVFKWLLIPMQESRPGKGISEIQWESFSVNASSPNLSQDIDRILKENELVISDWAPVHLSNLLKTWFWKDLKETNALELWHKSCSYLYFPRLKDESVFRTTLAAGTSTSDFFGIAYGKEGNKYVGFDLGNSVAPILDSSLILIEPSVASVYAKNQKSLNLLQQSDLPTSNEGVSNRNQNPSENSSTMGSSSVKKRFYSNIDLNAIRAKKDFSDIVDEVIEQFTTRPDVKVTISIEIQAETTSKFEDEIQRSVKENCKVLKFRTSEFE